MRQKYLWEDHTYFEMGKSDQFAHCPNVYSGNWKGAETLMNVNASELLPFLMSLSLSGCLEGFFSL